MSNESMFEELQTILSEQGIEIKYGRGYFEGGVCRYKDSKYFYLNRAQDIENHVLLMVSEVKKMNIENLKCSPDLENLLQSIESN
jgi:hypothetical protein